MAPGRMRGAGGPNVSQVFETGIWVFHVGQVRRGGRRAPLPRSLGPGPAPAPGCAPCTRRARPAPEAAERRPGPPGAGPRAQAARLTSVAARGRLESGARRRAGALHLQPPGSEGRGPEEAESRAESPGTVVNHVEPCQREQIHLVNYVEDCLDSIESLPFDLQRNVSLMREIDAK